MDLRHLSPQNGKRPVRENPCYGQRCKCLHFPFHRNSIAALCMYDGIRGLFHIFFRLPYDKEIMMIMCIRGSRGAFLHRASADQSQTVSAIFPVSFKDHGEIVRAVFPVDFAMMHRKLCLFSFDKGGVRLYFQDATDHAPFFDWSF